MPRHVTVERTDSVPKGASVFDYDELNDELKERFPDLIETAPTEEPARPECVLSSGDYVKYTDYYRVTCQ